MTNANATAKVQGALMTGKIRKLYKDKGFGFIKGANGNDYFFHRTAIKNYSFDDLQEGIEVSFEETEGQKGLRAEDIYVE